MNKNIRTPLAHKPVFTKNTQLASALSALNIPFEEPFWSKVTDESGKQTVTWHFEGKSKCGKYVTKELIDAWYSDEWYEKNYPQHPFALLICALNTKEYLVDKIKESKGHVLIRKGTKQFYCVEDSPMHKKLTNRY
jgi:hypothetical protein